MLAKLRERLSEGAAVPALPIGGADLPIDRFISTDELCRVTGYSRTTLWREVRAGRCVQPVRLSPGRVGFPESEVRLWVHGLIEARA